MEDFYKKWFEFNRQENEKALNRRKARRPVASTQVVPNNNEPVQQDINDPTDIVYENSDLKLIVEKGVHRHQKIFKTHDHLFHFRIIAKNSSKKLPLLMDVFDFLHSAFVHVLESIKTFYKSEDHNIAYLTIHQEPMINGLNSGKMLN